MNVRQIKTATLQQILDCDVLPFNMIALVDRFVELTGKDFQVIWNSANNTMTILTEKQIGQLPLRDEYEVIYDSTDPKSVWVTQDCLALDEANKLIQELPLWWDAIEMAYRKQKAKHHEF